MNIKVSKNDDGFLAQVDSVQGAFAEGDTPYEAIYNLMDVLNLISEYKNQKFPAKKFAKPISFTLPEFA